MCGAGGGGFTPFPHIGAIHRTDYDNIMQVSKTF